MIYILSVETTDMDAHIVQISHVIRKNRNVLDVFIVHPPYLNFLLSHFLIKYHLLHDIQT